MKKIVLTMFLSTLDELKNDDELFNTIIDISI